MVRKYSGRYTTPQPRHRARAGGLIIGGVEIISPRTKIHADSIYAGTIDADRIIAGNITADKIISGTILGARIGTIPANRTSSGSFGAVRIPNLSANKITSGSISANFIKGGTILSGNLLIGSPIRVKINATNKLIQVYYSSGVLRVEIGSLS